MQGHLRKHDSSRQMASECLQGPGANRAARSISGRRTALSPQPQVAQTRHFPTMPQQSCGGLNSVARAICALRVLRSLRHCEATGVRSPCQCAQHGAQTSVTSQRLNLGQPVVPTRPSSAVEELNFAPLRTACSPRFIAYASHLTMELLDLSGVLNSTSTEFVAHGSPPHEPPLPHPQAS
jgi:hypothetical protein